MDTKRRGEVLRHYGLLLLGVAILAFGLYNVHSRTAITEGGVLGMTLLLQHWFHWSPGVTSFFLNAICYLVGLRLLGRAFLKNAVVASVGFSLFYRLFEHWGYVLPDLTPWPLAASLLGGLLVGVGVGLVVREGGASGGDDALALILAKVFRCRISAAYLATDLTVLLLSLSYIPVRRILYSLLTVTLSSLLIDRVQNFRLPRRRGAQAPDEA